MSISALDLHLQTGATTVARAWSITRLDGLQLGFTDHDLPLVFDGLSFLPETGMTARALTQSSGLAVDNSEALGVLSDARISEADINAGLYDGAEVTTWLVNWQDVAARKILFKGHLGEIRRSGIGFEAELRGLTEALNQPQGRVFQSQCAAVLGHAACGVDLTDPAFVSQRAIEVITDANGCNGRILAAMTWVGLPLGGCRYWMGLESPYPLGSRPIMSRPVFGSSICGSHCGPRFRSVIWYCSRRDAIRRQRPVPENSKI